MKTSAQMKDKPPTSDKKPEISKEDLGLAEYVPHGAKDSIKLSIGLTRRLLTQPTKKGKVASDDDCLKYIAMCRAKRLNPFEGDSFLVGYDDSETGGAKFSQITAHQVFLKRAEVNTDFDGMQSGIIVQDEDGAIAEIEGDFHSQDQTVVGGWAKVYCKSRKYPWYKKVRLSAFFKDNKFWKGNSAGMICKVAEADALRSAFPTMLGGLYNSEEINLIPQQSNSTYSSEPGFTRPKIEATPKPSRVTVEPEKQEDSPKAETNDAGDGPPQETKTEPSPTTPIDELIP